MDYHSKYLRYIDLKNEISIGGGEPIIDSDIMFRDENVCILKPHVKKGIVVFSNFTQPENSESLCRIGLKTGEQLHKEGVDFNRIIYHPHIFFRAPYYSREINYTSVEKEIVSSYGEEALSQNSKVYIRVDPDRTFVFSSEIRDIFKYIKWFGKVDSIIQNSRKTLTQYLEIINDNLRYEQNVLPNEKVMYDLFSSRAKIFPISQTRFFGEYDKEEINKNSEILVAIPHLTPDYFVFCKN